MEPHVLKIENSEIWLDDFKLREVNSYKLEAVAGEASRLTITLYIDDTSKSNS